MKKFFTLIALCFSTLTLSAQTIYICKDGDYTTKTLTEGLQINLNDTPDSINFYNIT